MASMIVVGADADLSWQLDRQDRLTVELHH
jgi:hypothetical protein